MSNDEFMDKFFKFAEIFLLISICFSVGVFIGHRQAKDWNVIQKHREMELDKNYQYCPYCGEELRGEE